MTDLHISFDLETLGTVPGAPIVSIGFAVFMMEQGVISHGQLVMDLGAQSMRLASADTIRWWMGQSEPARAVFKDTTTTSLSGLTPHKAHDSLRFIIQQWATELLTYPERATYPGGDASEKDSCAILTRPRRYWGGASSRPDGFSGWL